MRSQTPWCSILLSAVTAIASISASIAIHGVPFSAVVSRDLLTLGAIDSTAVAAGEWWRLLSCQLVHVRPPHMVFNVLMIVAVGSVVEMSIGALRTLALYWASGTAGIAAGLLWAPSLIASGASQALMGLLAAGIVSRWRGFHVPRWFVPIAAAVLAVQIALDLLHAHHVKPGHTIALVVGGLLGHALLPSTVPAEGDRTS